MQVFFFSKIKVQKFITKCLELCNKKKSSMFFEVDGRSYFTLFIAILQSRRLRLLACKRRVRSTERL